VQSYTTYAAAQTAGAINDAIEAFLRFMGAEGATALKAAGIY